MIRLGAVLVTVGLVLSAVTFPTSSLAGVVLAGSVIGAGFGLSWSFMCQRILMGLPTEDRALGAAGITTVRLTGLSVGAAGCRGRRESARLLTRSHRGSCTIRCGLGVRRVHARCDAGNLDSVAARAVGASASL